jgi:hypothetical protein
MEKYVRTVYGALLETAQYQKTPLVYMDNMTLNEKFDFLKGTYPNPNEYPAVRYFGIGVGGHTASIGANGMTKLEIYQHSPTDAACFSKSDGTTCHVPFVMRELTDDLGPDARANYGGRVIQQHNGVNYVCYMVKRLPTAGIAPQLVYKTVSPDGDVTATPWAPTADNLNPKPRPFTTNGVNIVSGDYISATSVNTIKFTRAEITELENVGKILFGDPDYMIISEIALIAAVDRTVQVSGAGGASFMFNEVAGAFITNFLGCAYPITSINEELGISVDVGVNEPLFAYQQG